MATSSTTGRLAAFPPLLISQNPRSHPARLHFNRVVRSLHEEKEAAATNGVDFDGKLPLFGAQFLSTSQTAFRQKSAHHEFSFGLFLVEFVNYIIWKTWKRVLHCVVSHREVDMQLLRCSGEGSYWEP